MSQNSKREQILAAMETRVKALPLVTTVKRQPQSAADLDEYVEREFPVVAVVGGFPVPRETKWSGRNHQTPDLFLSQMIVELYYYDRIDDEQDTRMSRLADDLWRVVWADETVAGLILRMETAFESLPSYRHPYVAFKLNCTMEYKHTRGGI